ncbi:HAMP domain-containing sensor histidine kinase [Tepidimicrobium xylanilyticum]
MKERSFKSKFIIAFIKILALSLIFSILTFIIWSLTFDYIRFPANYYEREVVDIIEAISTKHDDVLNKNFQSVLEETVPRGGILYQVLDENGKIIYGTYNEEIIKGKKNLMNNLNSNIRLGRGLYARITPILNKDNNIKGATVFIYTLKSMQKTENHFLFLLSNMMMLSPFIFIIMFTLIYAKKLAKEINEPVRLLLGASEMIKNQNLDFTIEYNQKNEFTKLIAAFEDMRKNLKESLIRQWKLEEKRRENIANIAHDLKTPLTIVNTYVEAMLDGTVKEEKIKDYLEVIKRNNERALILLVDLNTLSDVENPDFTLNPVEVNIIDFLNSKEKDYKILCENRGIDFKIEIEDFRIKNITAKFDIKSLEQVLDNCISNSIRYTEKGGFIKVNALCKEEEIEFKVIDTGKGFSNEDLKNIFNKFYKGDKSRSFSSGHSGLGMYIAKTIVEKHGGSIEAENNTPKGAVIRFNIKPMAI